MKLYKLTRPGKSPAYFRKIQSIADALNIGRMDIYNRNRPDESGKKPDRIEIGDAVIQVIYTKD